MLKSRPFRAVPLFGRMRKAARDRDLLELRDYLRRVYNRGLTVRAVNRVA